MRVLVTGSSGLIGSSLSRSLEAEGYEILTAVRNHTERENEVSWDPAEGTIDYAKLRGVGAVVHLAGANIGRKWWSARHKKRIYTSRVEGTRSLAEAMASIDPPPSVLVSASANGYYGDRGEEVLTEESGPGSGFRAEVCQQWENKTAAAANAGIRVVRLRTGLVLAAHGGLLPYLIAPARLGLSMRLGSGRQYWSWVSIHDVVRAILFVIEHAHIAGAVNVVSPNPVRQAEFAEALSQVLEGGAVFPVPSALIKALLGVERANEILLSSQYAVPSRLLDAGFEFSLPELEPTLRNLLLKPMEVG